MKKQMAQLTISMSKLEAQGKLPSHTEKNPKNNSCAITLRGGKSYKGSDQPEDNEDEIVVENETEVKKRSSKARKSYRIEVNFTPPPYHSRM